MNPTAAMWAERQIQRRQEADLRKIFREANEAQEAARPLIEEARKRREAAMRMEGERGFVMVVK